MSTHHEFDLSVVSFALLLTIVQKQMSLALLTLAAGDLWQSGTPCQQWELFVFGSFQEMPPRATTVEGVGSLCAGSAQLGCQHGQAHISQEPRAVTLSHELLWPFNVTRAGWGMPC